MAEVRAENPQAGASGLPFMKRMMRFSEMASWRASRIGLGLCSLMGTSLGSGLDRQGVDAAAQLCPEHLVDEPVLREAWQAPEGRGDDDGVEMVAIAGDRGRGAWNPGLDAGFQLLRRRGGRGGGHGLQA